MLIIQQFLQVYQQIKLKLWQGFNKQGYNINVEDIGSEEYSEEEEEEGRV